MAIFDIFEKLTEEPKVADQFARPRLPAVTPPPTPPPTQGPVLGMTPGGPIRAPALAAGAAALGAGLTAQPDQAQGAGMGSIFDKFNELIKNKMEVTPSWATQTEMPMTAHAQKTQALFDKASDIIHAMKAGNISANKALFLLGKYQIPNEGQFKAFWKEQKAFSDIQENLAKEENKPKPSPAPKVPEVESTEYEAPPKEAPRELVDFSKYVPVGPQLGSNPGGTFADAKGQNWYIKLPKDSDKYSSYGVKGKDLARNEMLGNELYRVAGVRVPEMMLGTKDGKAAVASRMIDLKPHPEDFDKVIPYLQEDFAIDAWLANWDVAGLKFDNVIFDPANPANHYRVDQGGSLMYRAQGTPKRTTGLMLTSDVSEVSTLRGLQNPSTESSFVNEQATKIFGKMTADQLRASARKLENVNPFMIADAVQKYGPDDPIAARNLTKLLLRRRANVIQQLDPRYSPEDELQRITRTPEWMQLWHGAHDTFAGKGINVSGEGGFWMTPDKDLAKMYGKPNEFIAKTSDFLRYDAEGKVYANVNPYVLRKAREGFYPGIIIDNIYDAPGGHHPGPPKTVVIALDPAVVRRPGARFDPKSYSLNDLLASGAAIAVPSAIAAGLSGVPMDQAQAAPWDIRFMPGRMRGAVGKSGYELREATSAKPLPAGYQPLAILDPNGEVAGYLVTRMGTEENQRHLVIENIQTEKGPGSIGHEAVKDLLNQLLAAYPDAEGIGGYRISGGREKAKKADRIAGMSLKEIVAAVGTGGAAALGLGGGDQAQAAPPISLPATLSREPKDLETQGKFEAAKRELAAKLEKAGQTEKPSVLSDVVGGFKRAVTSGVESIKAGAEELSGAKPPEAPGELARALIIKRLKDDKPYEQWTDKEKRDWQQAVGAFEVVGGGMQMLMSPATGVLDAIVKRAFPDTTKEVQEFISDVLSNVAAPSGGLGAASKFAKTAARFKLPKVPNLGASGGAMVTPSISGVKAAAQQAALPVRKLFSPQTVSATAEDVAGIIRQKTGIGARYSEITKAALGDDPTKSAVENLTQNFERRMNDLPPAEQRELLKYLEGVGSTSPVIKDPQIQAIADEFRLAMEDRRERLEQIPRFAKMKFIEDYVPHYWKDQQKARAFAQQWASTQLEGTGAKGHVKKRTIPTIEDGISYGLEPVTTNLIDLAGRYVEQMDRYIANEQILDAMETAGHAKFVRKGSVIPDGWRALEGNFAERGDWIAVAPADVARVYNRYASRGITGELYRPVYESLQASGNAITATELGLSAFHLTTMAGEGVVNDAARAVAQVSGSVGKAASGELRDAARLLKGGLRSGLRASIGATGVGATAAAAGKTFAGVSAVAGPVAGTIAGTLVGVAGLVGMGAGKLLRGDKIQRIYLGRAPASTAPALRHITNLLTAAGGRAVGKAHTMREYQFSPMGSFFTQWKRAGSQGLYRQLRREFATNPAKAAFNQLGRIFESLSQPLFEVYIPKMKTGAFYDNMRAWLEANPTASLDQQLVVARRIWDSIDNRFGELVQDNIYWTKTSKQLAMLAMRSYSWNMGTLREIGGGMLSAVKRPRGVSIAAGKEWDPRISYVIALPVMSALMGSVYQYLKTGKSAGDGTPEGMLRDLMVPQTGGQVSGVGGRGEVPERAQLPGYMRDVFGWFNDWQGEIKNKLATGPRLAVELIQNKDWRGDPITWPEGTRPEGYWPDGMSGAPIPDWLKDYATYLFAGNDPQLGPISIRNLIQGEKTGSGITTAEQFLGIRPASMYMQDPEGMERAHRISERRAGKMKGRHLRQRERAYGPQE